MDTGSHLSQRRHGASGRGIVAQPRTTSAQMRTLEERIAQMNNLSNELGFSTMSNIKLAKCLGTAISKRLRTRGENFTYQSAAFSLDNFPRSYAQNVFPESCVIENSAKVQTWRMETMLEVSQAFRDLLAMTTRMSAGCLRGMLLSHMCKDKSALSASTIPCSQR